MYPNKCYKIALEALTSQIYKAIVVTADNETIEFYTDDSEEPHFVMAYDGNNSDLCVYAVSQNFDALLGQRIQSVVQKTYYVPCDFENLDDDRYSTYTDVIFNTIDMEATATWVNHYERQKPTLFINANYL